jgi:hypothetical protein
VNDRAPAEERQRVKLAIGHGGERFVILAIEIRNHVLDRGDGLLECRQLPEFVVANLDAAVLECDDQFAPPLLELDQGQSMIGWVLHHAPLGFLDAILATFR